MRRCRMEKYIDWIVKNKLSWISGLYLIRKKAARFY